VFGFASHILLLKTIEPIGKTDIYNVLTTGGFNPPRWYEAQKNKKKGGKI
jgi:hypothetical protein